MSINYGDICRRVEFRPLPPLPGADLAGLVRELRLLQRRARRQNDPYFGANVSTAAAARALEALVDRELGLSPWE